MLNDDVYGDHNDDINDFDDDNDGEIDYDTNSRDNPLKEEPTRGWWSLLT